jgi:hypothetical protein
VQVETLVLGLLMPMVAMAVLVALAVMLEFQQVAAVEVQAREEL